jgi:hypothetical protein
MQFRRSAIVVGLLIAACGLSATPAQVDVPAWAAAFLQSWYSAYNDGDAAGWRRCILRMLYWGSTTATMAPWVQRALLRLEQA